MGTADYGRDLAGITDIDATGIERTGVVVLQEAIARRLSTPRGWVLDDPNYGYDVREEVGEDVDAAKLARIRAAVRAEVLKDKRVLTCQVTASVTGSVSNLALTLTIDGLAAFGPYALTLEVSRVSVELLQREG